MAKGRKVQGGRILSQGTVRVVSQTVELQLHFVSILTFCLFDCLVDGITTLFVFSHIPSQLAMVKYSGSRFQFCANADIYPLFLVGVA